VADGERMNPQGKGGAFAPNAGDDEHQSDEDPENSPAPGSSLHQREENPAPGKPICKRDAASTAET
jgi:hypothetical protein